MINSQHFLFDISILVLAIAIIVHTVDEAWFGAEQKASSDWRTVIFNRALFLDNLPIFIFVIGAEEGWLAMGDCRRNFTSNWSDSYLISCT